MSQAREREQNMERERVLTALRKAGVMSPLEISAQVLLSPTRAFRLLEEMEKDGLVLMRISPSSPDGKLVFLSEKGLEIVLRTFSLEFSF